jgi:hypothetical protein
MILPMRTLDGRSKAMNSPESPVPSKSEPHGARPVLPSGIEAGVLGGAAVAIVFLARDLLVGIPMHTPSVLGTLMLEGADAARTVTSAPGPAIAYNAVHFTVWVVAGSIGIVLMRQVEASASNWYRPWVAACLLTVGCVLASARASAAALPQLHLWLGTLVGVGVMGWFLGWRHPRAMKRIRQMGGD